MSWSDLPIDIATAIADRLTDLADLARFRSVCPSWRSASAAHAACRRVPLLLLPTRDYDTAVNRRVWSPADDSLSEVQLPAARGRSFLFASNHGWTLAVSSGDLSATLVHPFTGASSGLPALPFLSRDDYDTIPRELVWDWSPHGVLVSPRNGAFFSEEFPAVFCRPGDGSWRPVGCSSASISSITYCDGVFYLFDGKTCKATVVDAETLAVAAVIEPPALEIPWSEFETNLVVSADELLLLVKSWDWQGHKNYARAFRAKRAPPGGGRSPSWSPVADIGERAVFMDHHRAFCVEANGLNGVRRNCLYLARSYEEVNDDYWWDVNGRYTVSVRDLADHSHRSENLGRGSLLDVYCSSFWQYPSWLLPNPH